MKITVTLRLDDALVREARRIAAEEDRPLSAVLTEHLEAIVRPHRDFDQTLRRAVARLWEGLDLRWTPPKSRDELTR